MAVGHHHHHRPATPDRLSRSSFSSIREDDSALTQDFSRSKVSSYLRLEDAIAIDDRDLVQPPKSPNPPNLKAQTNMIQTQFQPPVTHPQSRLLGYWSPAENFQGWKQIQVKGKLASKSFGDLQVLNNVWITPTKPRAAKKGTNKPGEAPLERLPPELLSKSTSFSGPFAAGLC